MNSNDIQTGREFLKIKKCQALMLGLIPIVAYISWGIIKASNQWSAWIEFVSSITAYTICIWYLTKSIHVFNDIRKSKEQMDEEERTTWREGVAARIRSGELKPNPDLK